MHRNRACLVAAALLAAAWTAPASPAEGFKALEFTASSGKTLRYQLLEPGAVEPGRKVPLAIFLHGTGERGSDNRRQLANGVKEFFLKGNTKSCNGHCVTFYKKDNTNIN